jgi:hypothetical protein
MEVRKKTNRRALRCLYKKSMGYPTFKEMLHAAMADIRWKMSADGKRRARNRRKAAKRAR